MSYSFLISPSPVPTAFSFLLAAFNLFFVNLERTINTLSYFEKNVIFTSPSFSILEMKIAEENMNDRNNL